MSRYADYFLRAEKPSSLVDTQVVSSLLSTAAALLAAGLDGIENKMDPGQVNASNLYEVPDEDLRRRKIKVLPTTLSEAVDCFEQDEVLQDALGKPYAAYYAGVKRDEWREFHQSVGQWERDRYLKTY